MMIKITQMTRITSSNPLKDGESEKKRMVIVRVKTEMKQLQQCFPATTLQRPMNGISHGFWYSVYLRYGSIL